jgi:hypothetical protein
MHRNQVVKAVLVLMLAGCARDLELPADRGVPRLTAIAPLQAYGGEWLRISGTAFDPTPASNRIQFASGVAVPGAALDGGVLLVRVPPGAGDGAITVSNNRGPSAPYGTFKYLGRGELERGQVVASRALLHEPSAIVAAGGSFYLQSKLWNGLVNLTDSAFKGDGAEGAVAIDGGTALAWIDRSDPLAPTIVRHDAASGAVISVPAPTEPYVYLAAIEGTTPKLAVVATDQATVTLESLNAADLTVADGPRSLAVEDVDAVADAGGGRVAMVGRQSAIGPTGLFVASPSGSPSDRWVDPGAVVLAGYQAAQPLTVATGSLGNRIAVVVALDGDLYTVDMGPDGATGAFSFDAAPIALHLTVGRPSGLAADGKYVVVSKKTEGLLLGIDVGARALVWSVNDSSPGAAVGAGGYFTVAGTESNDALDLEEVKGIARARWDFSLFPGRLDSVDGNLVARPGAVAWCGPPACAKPELRIANSYPSGVLSLPLGATTGASGKTVAETGGVALVDSTQWTWSEPATVAGWVTSAVGAATPVTASFADAVLRVLPDATGAWVLHESGLSRVEGGAVVGDSSFANPATRAIQPIVLPDGALAAAWGDAVDGWQVATFTRASVIAGSGPAPLSLPVEADLLFVADGECWLVASGPDGLGNYLDGAMRLSGYPVTNPETVDLTAAVYNTVGLSPNGRMLVRQTGSGLQLRRADPRQDFPILSEFPIEGSVTGVTFDAGGETAFVVTRLPEKILTLQ